MFTAALLIIQETKVCWMILWYLGCLLDSTTRKIRAVAVEELETIAEDLNSIYKAKYGKTPFSVKKETITTKKKIDGKLQAICNDGRNTR